jgi:hypothetical protein
MSLILINRLAKSSFSPSSFIFEAFSASLFNVEKVRSLVLMRLEQYLLLRISVDYANVLAASLMANVSTWVILRR